MRLFPLLILFFFVIRSQFAICQNESNIWYFGKNAGIDFNGSIPEVLNNSNMTSYEGCATICDNNGDLLFYTNGVQLWNKNHEFMENGSNLMGGLSSSQSVIIVPNPIQHNIFYVFTVDQIEDAMAYGLRYSEIDIYLDNGLGAIIENKKNILLHTPAYEKLTSVIHENGVYKWVIVHDHESNALYSFLVNGSGVDINPVISQGGPIVDHLRHSIGLIKATLDGNFLVISSLEQGYVCLYSFDKMTGEIGEQKLFEKTFNSQISGIEFSPSGKLIYITEYKIGGKIFQYDLYSSNIENSRMLIGTASNNYDPPIINPASLQLAANRKIYQAMTFAKFLNVIKYPDIRGQDCQYVHEAINLGDNISHLGLPQLIYLNITTDFAFENTCIGLPTSFIPLASPNYDSLYWNFGDPSSGMDSSSTLDYPIHIYSESGPYRVQLIAYYYNQTDTISHEIFIDDIRFTLGADTTLCAGETILLETGIDSINVNYLWQDSSNLVDYRVEQEGIYWAILNKNYCINSDTIIVNYKSPPPVFNLGNDSSLCEGSFIELVAPIAEVSYTWQDGSSDTIYSAFESGTYRLDLDNMCGSSSDEVLFDFKDCSCVPDIPNAFSPNGDGLNDIFKAVSNCTFYQYNFKVFNRLGLILYETNELDEGWNGLYNNIVSPQQTYIYQITYQVLSSLPSNELIGSFTLIR